MRKQREGLVQLDVERVERLRLLRGLSKTELARSADVSRHSVIRAFRGEGCFPSTARALAEVLGVQVTELLRRKDDAAGSESRSYALPGTDEWEVDAYVSDWKQASNGLQFRVCRVRHRLDPRQVGRGKFYDLLRLSLKQREEARHYLVRHFAVSGRVGAHPHVIENRGCVPLDDLSGWWVIDRWVDGEALSEHLAGEPWPRARLPRLMREVAEGLSALHAAGVVFRELAPSRVLIAGDDGRAVLTEFELAKLLDGSPSVSVDWPDDPYRAPEVESGHATVQADLYSWARVLVHAALGTLPPPGADREQLATLGLPSPVYKVAAACLSPGPGERPPGIQAVLDVLGGWRT